MSKNDSGSPRMSGDDLARLLDDLGFGYFQIDNRTGSVLLGSDATARMIGLSRAEDAAGMSVTDFYADPKERAEAMATLLTDPVVRETGVARLMAQRKRPDTGEAAKLLMHVKIRPDETGAPVRLDVVFENLGDRERISRRFEESSGERFLRVFEDSFVATVLTKTDGTITRVNSAFCEFVGRPEAELLATPLAQLISPQDADKPLPGAHGTPQKGIELRFLHTSGATVWGYASVSWLAGLTEMDDTSVVMVQDITQRKLTELELSRIERIDSLAVLAGGVAHDFNNLLTGITGNLSLLGVEAARHPDLLQYVRDAQEATARATSLTRQLLTFSKGSASIRQVTSLSPTLREAAEFAVRGSTVGTELDFAADLWNVNCDVDQIYQVFSNLVLNAVQAMPDGGVTLVEARNQALGEHSGVPLPAGEYVRIRVRDGGVGIPADMLPRIFDPYFSTKSAGTGLGLASAHTIVRSHAGHVEASSSEEDGTTFTVYLPACKDGVPCPGPRTDVESLGTLGGRVLVMDDEPVIRNVATRMLQSFGSEVVAVADGGAAVAAYEQALQDGHRFDAVLLDLTVPGGMGGEEALEQIVRLDAEVRAVVTSGYAVNPVLSDFRGCGFMGAIVKPFSAHQLYHVFADVLDVGA